MPFTKFSTIPAMRLTVFAFFVLFLCMMRPDAKADQPVHQSIRIATYNVSLYDKAAGLVRDRLADGIDSKAAKIAAVVQTVRPDILLVNEIDFDHGGETAKLFASHFLAQSQHDCEPIEYPFVYAAASNTGIDSALDLDRDGITGSPTDAWGFGTYPGQYSYAVLSRFPIDEAGIRTFQKFRWKDLPDAKKPVDPQTGKPYYNDEVWNSLRLSSKNHVDVPIQVGETTLHILASHPTPPVFDGPEDRNGNRNHDEVRFWHHYISSPEAAWLTDDLGRVGGIDSDALFVIAGDLNTDPSNGDSNHRAIIELIGHDRVQDPKPIRSGHSRSRATASFGPQRELRIDYVLPSRNIEVIDSGVYWPAKSDATHQWILATDHRMVWIEVKLP
jgi:endonuclease/exonuclease/phosphatase family metal-dependent hydrolase